MAVLIEVFSLVLRVDRVAERFPDGWMAFERHVRKHPSYCNDGELARLAFLTEADVQALIKDLRAAGLRHIVEGPAGRRTEDMAVLDQDQGLLDATDWLDFHHVDVGTAGEKRAVPVARLKGSTQTRTVFPTGWRWEESSFVRGRP